MKDQENTTISYHTLLLLGAALEIRREGRGRLDFLKQAGHVDGIHRLDLGLLQPHASLCTQCFFGGHKYIRGGDVGEDEGAGEVHRDDLQAVDEVLAFTTEEGWQKEGASRST